MEPTHLQELAKRHEMTYHVLPEWGADAKWNQQRIGFQVELQGVVRDDADASRNALREVAEWAFGEGADDVKLSIDPSRGNVLHEPSKKAWLVELVGHVLHQGDVRHAVDASEEHYVREVKERLSSIGISER
jgi:hypothetical protein